MSTDSRTIRSGELFVALVGDQFDGHHFALNALEKGALAAVVNRDWYERNKERAQSYNFIVVEDSLKAYQEFARYYLSKFGLHKIALTGSSGKTTTKEAIYSVLSQKFNVLRNIKSYNNHVGVPATIFSLRPEHDVLLSEMGTNHFGELARLSYIVEPTVCVLTNIGFAHLEFFKSLDGVLKAKMEIFASAARDGTAIYNFDDPRLRKQTFPVAHKLSFGLTPGADVQATIINCDDQACYTFEVQKRRFKLRVPGRHNVANALAAVAVGKHFGLTLDEIAAGLATFSAVDQRMHVFDINGIRVLDDSYNSNPDSCRAAFSTVADMRLDSAARRIAVLGDMLELGDYSRAEHERLADEAAQYKFDALFLFGEETKWTAQRAQQIGLRHVAHFEDKDELHRQLLRFIRRGDIVLVKGSRGMKMETVIKALKSRN